MCPYLSELFLQDTLLFSDSQGSAIHRVLDFKDGWALLFLNLLKGDGLRHYIVPELVAVIVCLSKLIQTKSKGTKLVRALSPSRPL